MLDQIREKSSHWLIKVALGVIVLVFIFWGFGVMNQAALKAAIPPLLPPAMHRSLPLVDKLRSNSVATNGISSSIRKRTMLSPTPSYSKQRLRRPMVF